MLILLFSLVLSLVLAGQDRVEITANVVGGNVNSKLEAHGNVLVKYQSMTVKGEHAYYDKVKGLLRVEGNVEILEGETHLFCKRLIYDFKNKKAVLENVEGNLSSVDRIKADRIVRLSEKEWIAYDGEYTPCKGKCPDWSLGSKKFRILLGESFAGKWVSFKVKEIPVLITPFASGPIVKDRTSGLLAPRTGYVAEGGFFYRQPLFIVLGRSADLTLSYEKRFREGDARTAEFRYVLSPHSRGSAWYEMVRQEDRKDWKLKYAHTYFPSRYFYAKVNSELVNSRRYYKSSATLETEEETRIYTKSEGDFSKLWKTAVLNTSVVYLNYLDGSSSSIYQRLPSVRFYLLDRPISKRLPVSLDLGGEAVYFYREAGGSSYRINLEPGIRFTKSQGPFKNSLKLQYLLTRYKEGDSRTIFKLENTSTYYKSFLFGSKYLSLVPEVSLRFVENEDQSKNPFYDISDRVSKEKKILSRINTFLYGSSGRILRLSLEGGYDLYQDTNKLGEWSLDSEISTPFGATLRETLFFEPSGLDLNKANTEISAKLYSVSTWFNVFRDLQESVNYLRWGLGFPINRYVSFSFSQRYDMKLSESREQQYSIRINRFCWSGLLTYRWIKHYDNTIDYQIMFFIDFLRLGKYGYTFTGRR